MLAFGVVVSMFASNQIPPSGFGSFVGFGSMAVGFVTFLIGRFMD